MFKSLLILAVAATSLATVAHAAPSLEDRVAELEAQKTLNYFKFSGLLETRYDSITDKQTEAGSLNDKVDYLRLRSSLNVDADVSDRIKFYSRITATKFFNQFTQGAAINQTPDLTQGRDYLGRSTLFLEKAYADITLEKGDSDSTVFSMGRMPTIDGPPMEYKEGRERMGTYPAMAYDSIFDGFALSYNYKFTPERTLSARVVYTPFITVNMGNTASATPGTVPPYLTSPSAGGSPVPNFMNLSTVMLDWDQKDAGFTNEMSIIWQSYLTDKTYTDGVALGGSGGVSTTFTGHTLTASFNGIAGTGLNFALSAAYTDIANAGTITLGPTSLYGFNAGAQGDHSKGMSYFAALNYKFNKTYTVGGEYVAIDRGGFSPIFVTDDVTNFYQTVGNSYDVYALFRPLDEFSIRLGYAHQQANYSGFTMAPIVPSDQKIDTAYANFRLDF